MSYHKQTTQELVEEYCQQEKIRDGLVYVQDIDAFYKYDEETNCYLPYKQNDFEREVYVFLSTQIAKNLTMAMVKDFIGQVKVMSYNRIDDINFDYVSLKLGKIINAKTGKIEIASREKMCFHYIAADPKWIEEYEECKLPERFAAFLDQVIVFKDKTPDKDTQKLLQEMAGYYLLNTLEAHAVFFLVGGGRNGKSVFLDLMREMIGKDFYTAMNVETMTGDQFAAAGLVGKKMNICAEDESGFVKTDKFKAMIAGDPITVQRKYGSHFTWEPTTKHLFASNEMPGFSGFNVALMERVKIIPFNRYFAEEERDTQLINKLKVEISGIVAWAVAGAKRLRENNFIFSTSEQCKEKADKFKENLSSAALFFNEQYTTAESMFTLDDELYESYKVWADGRGKKKQSFYSFRKDIETLTGLLSEQGKGEDGRSGLGKKVWRKDGVETPKKEEPNYKVWNT